MEKKIELSIVYVDIDELVPADYNPRFMTEEDRQDIKKRKSLTLFGFVDPVIVNRTPLSIQYYRRRPPKNYHCKRGIKLHKSSLCFCLFGA